MSALSIARFSMGPYQTNDLMTQFNEQASNQAVQRATHPDHLLDMGVITDSNLTLMQKWRLHYKKQLPSNTKSKYGFRLLFQFQAISQLYMALNYLIPYTCSKWSCDPMTVYCLKILACYLFVMGQANWLCAICYSCRLPDMRDRPNLEDAQWFQHFPYILSQNSFSKTLAKPIDKNGLEWRFCNKCERFKPPRTHHCEVCQTCILRRDHHCYLIGTCIGHYNQRYFIVLCFLGMVVSVLGLIFTLPYLSNMPDAVSWLDYVFPWSLLKLCFGHVSWQFCLLTFHTALMLMFGAMSVLYGTGQLILACIGMTLYEVAKQMDVRVTSSYSENLRIVFGDYWPLNFVFPAQIVFKQRHDGMDYNNLRIGNSKISME